MIRAFLARVHQGHRTIKYPDGPAPALPARFRGLPRIDASRCEQGCRDCAEACPTDAIRTDAIRLDGGVRLDLGRCLFCSECERACPQKSIEYTQDYRLAASNRDDLIIGEKDLRHAQAMGRELRRLLGRSLRLRVVSAGGCNGCEMDVNVLSTVVWDIGRFGIQYVASPRHADGLIVTGPVTENMQLALKKTYDAVPAPKIVIAVGACAISGGPYLNQREQHGGAASTLPVDLYIPGCPPHPLTILDGLLRLIGRNRPAETGKLQI